MDETQFKNSIRISLQDARERDRKKLVKEYGDEFGDVDLGNAADFKKVFIEPWTNATKVALGSVAKVSSKARSALAVILKGLPSLIIPGLSTRYENIFSNEDQRMQSIERKYGAIIEKARMVFKKEGELIAFLLNPIAMLTVKVAEAGPKASLELIDALAGHDSSITSKTSEIRKTFGLGESRSLNRALLHESSESDAIADLLNNKEITKSITSSNLVRNLNSDIKSIINTTLNDVLELAKKISGAETIGDAESILKKKIDTTPLEGVEGDQRDSALGALLTQVKDGQLQSLIESLTLGLKEFNSLDVPESADIIHAYENAIDRIESMLS